MATVGPRPYGCHVWLPAVFSDTVSDEASDFGDLDRWFKRLAVGGRLLDGLDDIHPLRHLAECGKPLTIDIALAAVIELGLVANADEKVGDRAVLGQTRHRDRGGVRCRWFVPGRSAHSARPADSG